MGHHQQRASNQFCNFSLASIDQMLYIYLVLTVGSLNIKRFLGKGAKEMRKEKTAKETKLSLFSSPPGLHLLKSPLLQPLWNA